MFNQYIVMNIALYFASYIIIAVVILFLLLNMISIIWKHENNTMINTMTKY